MGPQTTEHRPRAPQFAEASHNLRHARRLSDRTPNSPGMAAAVLVRQRFPREKRVSVLPFNHAQTSRTCAPNAHRNGWKKPVPILLLRPTRRHTHTQSCASLFGATHAAPFQPVLLIGGKHHYIGGLVNHLATTATTRTLPSLLSTWLLVVSRHDLPGLDDSLDHSLPATICTKAI